MGTGTVYSCFRCNLREAPVVASSRMFGTVVRQRDQSDGGGRKGL